MMTENLTYRPGTWYLAVGTTRLAFAPDRELAVQLWPAIAAEAPFEALVDVVLAAGIGALGQLVLIEKGPSGLRVLARGTARVAVELRDGTHQTVDAVGVSTWTERLVVDAAVVTIDGLEGSASDQGELPLVAGVVAAAQLQWTVDQHRPAHAAEPVTLSVLPSPRDGDHDGSTIIGSQLRSIRAQADGTTIVAPPATAVLAFSTGSRQRLDRPVIVGRRPQANKFAGAETPSLVTVPSPNGDISRSHVEIRSTGGRIVATDLQSTNGTEVHSADGHSSTVAPGESVVVQIGDQIDLGDGVTIDIRADQ